MRGQKNTQGAFADIASVAGSSRRSCGTVSGRLWATLVLSLSFLGALLLTPTAQASLGVLGSFGTPNGGGAGQLEEAQGIAVNRTGAGGATAGDVYVAEGFDGHRVQQFDSEGNPVRIFGWNVVASGPDNVIPASAVQKIEVPGSVSAGTFKLAFNGKTTTPLPFNATAAEVQSALVALSSIGEGSVSINNATVTGPNVEVSGGPGASVPFTVSFVKYLGETPVPSILADSSNLSGGAVSVSVTKEGVSGYEVCDVKANPTDICQAGNMELAPVQAGTLLEPQGVAIDQQTGVLYVTDPRSNRIDVYTATGEFDGGFAWGVIDGSPELQFCTTVCLKGVGEFIQFANVSSGAGQFGERIGHPDVAPVGSPHEGDLYVANTFGNRIDEFKPTITAGKVTGVSFQRAFGWDVVESGPDNVPAAKEVQSIEIPASVTGGTFTVSFEGQSTTSLPYNASAEALQKAMTSVLAPIEGFGQVNGGPQEHTPYTITFGGTLEANIPQLTVDSSGLVGGEAAVQTLIQGSSPYEVCNIAVHSTDVCRRGLSSFTRHHGQLWEPKDVGVDSGGAIYAVDGKQNARVEKYSPDGGFIEELAPASLNGTQFHSEETAPEELAIDPGNNHVFVAKKNGKETAQVLELDSSGNLLDTSPAASGFPAPFPSLTLGGEGKLYLASRSGSARVFILGPPPAPSATLGPVTNISATSATFTGTVTPPTPGGFATFYRFEYSTDGISWSRFPGEEDAEAGDGSGSGDPSNCPTEDPPTCNVTEIVNNLQPNATYQVRIRATTGNAFTTPVATFTTQAAPPTVSKTLAEEVGETTADLTGSINPNNQPTTYHFEWGKSTAYGHELPEYDAFTGQGGKAVKVFAPIKGLSPATVYHFRVVATNETGAIMGPDEEFITLDKAGLPDNRRPELVSPADKRPQGTVRPGVAGFAQAAEDGHAFAYQIYNGLLDTSAGGEVFYLAHRGAAEWSSEQLSPPSLVTTPAEGLNLNTVHYLSPDLSCGLLETYNPLTPDTPAADVELGVLNLYRISADGGHTLVSNTVPSNTTRDNHGHFSYEVGGTSPDCGRVYFETPYKLLPGASGVYEWDEGVLRDAGVLPDGAVPGKEISIDPGSRPVDAGGRSAVIGAGAATVNTVSRDGYRLFFSAYSDEGKDEGKVAVFMREGGSRTVDASQSTTATVPLGARYEMASKDGSHVYFAANYGLTASSSSGPSADCSNSAFGSATPCDLYAYDTETEALTDLSADTNPADTKGAVVEGVLDASEDGSYVYFAALGQLVPSQGNTYKQNLAGGGFANVYLSHEGQLSFVGEVEQMDLTKTSGSTVLARAKGGLSGGGNWSSQATPDGAHLLFTSRANVTGYVGGGAVEAYLYSAESGTTVCVSCRRDGRLSLGGSNENPIMTNNSPRSLSDDGSRVFFTMRDPLAPGAIAGNKSIYEWEKGQVYLLNNGKGTEPQLLGASASGDDVFLASTEQLDAHDTDFVGDVYDLRVDGGYPPPAEPPTPCDPAQDQCQGAPGTPPAASPPASSNFSGPGNPPAPAPGKSKHRKKHKKHKHSNKLRHHTRASDHKGGGK